MSRTVTLQQIREDVIDDADLGVVNDTTFITTSRLNRWINQSLRRFIGMLLGGPGDRYFESPHQFHTEDGTAQYALPADFFQLYQAAAIIDGQLYNIYPASNEELSWGEFTPLQSDEECQNSYDYLEGVVPSYRVLGQKIEMVPVPTQVYCVKLRYAPTKIVFNGSTNLPQVELVDDDDYIDGVNGWEEWIKLDVCEKAKAKSDEDAMAFMKAKAEIEREIKEQRRRRDRGPKFMRETYCDTPSGRRMGRFSWR